MEIIGRKVEQDVLSQAMDSQKPEFIVVYGRRRVGKTYLIKEYFNNRFAFYASGIPDQKSNKSKIKTFYESLKNYGDKTSKAPEDWYEAFRRLKNILNDPNVYRDPVSNKRVVFLDEVPWFDNKQGLFREALDFFWNTWASSEPDLCLIVCGSATSWITKEILLSKGGFYNRLTRTINLKPFTLKECELFYSAHGANITQSDIVKSYMVFGGIPYYMNLYENDIEQLQHQQNEESLNSTFNNLYRALNPNCPSGYTLPLNFQNLLKRILSTNFSIMKNDESKIINSLLDQVSQSTNFNQDALNKFQYLYARLTKKRSLTKRWGILYILNSFAKKNNVKDINFTATNELQQNYLENNNIPNNTLINRDFYTLNNINNKNIPYEGSNAKMQINNNSILNDFSPVSNINERFYENQNSINYNNMNNVGNNYQESNIVINRNKTSLIITEKDLINDLLFVFEGINGKYIAYDAEEDEVELGKEGSYPSGHTMRGWTTALLLAEINPANADTIYARGWMYGESRVIVGAHWQSDVDATRVAASIGYSALHTSPAFREQMHKAQYEFAMKTGLIKADDKKGKKPRKDKRRHWTGDTRRIGATN